MTTVMRGLRRLALVDELRDLAESDDFVGTLLRSAQLAAEAGRSPQSIEMIELVDELNELVDDGPFAGVLAIEVLGAIDHGAALESLSALLSSPDTLLRRHAAWRLRHRPVAADAVPRLLDMLVVGGIDTMHSHRTLRRWAKSDPAITGFAIDRLSATGDGRQRARLIDLLGAIDDPRTTEHLVQLAADAAEFGSARIAAIGALADRYGADEAALRRLAAGDDEVGAHATLAVCDRARAAAVGGRTAGGGLRIAQLTMAAGLDGQLSLGGRGDTGGVASLLVSLGEALAGRPEIDHVLTIGRGTVTDAILGSSHTALIPSGESSQSFATIAIGDDGRPAETTDDLWEHLPTIERGLRRIIRRAGGVDLLHLRMADAGTLAGAQTAVAEGIPTCFSLAPDPHNVLSSLRARGQADRDAVVRLATESHIWFRARLVERLARESDRIALFPRSKTIDFFTGSGAAPDRFDQRCAVVAEGIDIGLIRRAEAADSAATSGSAARGDVLADLASGIPKDRCHLPLLISVGRLNPVKGMDRVVAAWAADPLLHERFNLVIVGGDLENPSTTERSVIETIDRLVPAGDVRRAGLQLLGGRPRADVARLLVSAVRGLAGRWASGGVYVDGAWKEEFGLAVIEALAAGLVVVAPSTGGPPTYIDDGDIGVLVDPNADLGDAIIRAFGLVDRPGRAGRARRLIEQRYSVETMAERLAALYRPLAAMR
jgi:glycosyltransferase involved in cell wall biosynthesis